MAKLIGAPDASERTSSERPVVGSGPVGFGANAIPGMKTAPVEHVVRQKTRVEMAKNPEVWKSYNDLSRTIRIINRAAKGPMAGKAFAGKFDGQLWPEGAFEDDEESWLQPGEYMDVPKEVAWHLCGEFLWNPAARDSRMDIVNRYGDWEYEGYPDGISGGRPKMVRVGLPPLPDLVVGELAGRGDRIKGEWKVLLDIYLKGEKLGEVVLQAQPEEPFAVVKG